MDNVEQSYKQCELVIRKHSKTFHKAFSLLPEKKRNAVWAVYAFCRIVDDIVDEGSSPHRELAQFEMDFRIFQSGTLPSGDNQFMWIALGDAFSHFHLEITAFFDMIKGQRMDLVKTRYETFDEVLAYSYHVASTVGLMLIPILAPNKKQELTEGAIALGLAMQITNILRDVGEDLDRDRIYLPKELMERFHYTHLDLQNHVVNSSFVQLWEHMAKEAEAYYSKAMETIHLYPLHSRAPVKAAALLYREILTKIRQEDYCVFTEKHFVTNKEKTSILSNITTLEESMNAL